MRLFKIASIFAWLMMTVGVVRALTRIPGLIKEMINFSPVFKADFAGGLYQYAELTVDEIFFVSQSIAVGFLLLVVLKAANYSISPFGRDARVEL